MADKEHKMDEADKLAIKERSKLHKIAMKNEKDQKEKKKEKVREDLSSAGKK